MEQSLKTRIKGNFIAFLAFLFTFSGAWGLLYVERKNLDAERISILEKEKAIELESEKARLRLANAEDQQKKIARQLEEMELKNRVFDKESKLHEMILEYVKLYAHLDRHGGWSRSKGKEISDDEKRGAALLGAIHAYILDIGKEREYAKFLQDQGVTLMSDQAPSAPAAPIPSD